MAWADVGRWIASNAPGVAGLVGTMLSVAVPGAGPIVAAGIELVRQATGTDDPDAALARLQASPEAMLRLQELAAQREASVRAHVLESERLHLADVADARARDVSLAQAGRTNTRANWMVALDVVGLLACLVGMLLLGWMNAGSKISEGVFGALLVQLSTLAGFFGLCLRDAHQFEFGSSRGSKDKDDALIAVGRGAPPR